MLWQTKLHTKSAKQPCQVDKKAVPSLATRHCKENRQTFFDKKIAFPL